MARKTESEPRPTAAARIEELTVERQRITARVIALEQRGVTLTTPPGVVQHAKALALIGGADADEPVPVADDAGELARLHERRQVIARAIELLNEQARAEEIEHLRDAFERERPEWFSSIRKRVLCAIALARANADFEKYRRQFAALGLPTSGLRLGGFGERPGDDVLRAIEEAVRAGIITKKEGEL